KDTAPVDLFFQGVGDEARKADRPYNPQRFRYRHLLRFTRQVDQHRYGENRSSRSKKSQREPDQQGPDPEEYHRTRSESAFLISSFTHFTSYPLESRSAAAWMARGPSAQCTTSVFSFGRESI